ncbi:MAG: hypothetical protein PVF14_21835 [Desulfobacterales bacterium]|jgi:hypothetical protein
MNKYEVKYFDKSEWEEISEISILENLHDAFDRVTPSIQEMLRGKQVLTTQAKFRIKDR